MNAGVCYDSKQQREHAPEKQSPEERGRGWTCCPKGWKRFQGSCYYLSDDRMRWNESVQNCTGMGSHLVVINTEAEQGRGDVLSASLQHRLPSATSLTPQGLLCLPPLSPAPHGHCTLPDYQVFLTEEVQQSGVGFNYYIGLHAPVVGQWQWVDRTPYNKTAA
ncbi:hypothetical protein QYF61_003279 [Mycteria americana]|uniref:Uncharacterized protein n=1 Tax=Mycteria americana TaxID=33587 RepID=A0AAN7S5P4_MYCAM|nr:hypothetical protein QYF61_003279 [Mycteria americana]